jgi:hypothetical protein
MSSSGDLLDGDLVAEPLQATHAAADDGVAVEAVWAEVG